MKHLCVINPKASQVNGHVDGIVDTIKDFFARNPRLSYSVHITRWKRDASGYVRRYVGNSPEMVRVYVFGGSGTVFEVLNGVMGLPNVQVAYFPLGKEDRLFVSLGVNSKEAFTSMPNLLFSRAFSVDTILAGNHYVLSGISIGVGALASRLAKSLSAQLMLPLRIAYTFAGLYCLLAKNTVQHYRLEAENITVEDNFAGLFIANVPGSSGNFFATDARLHDGYMDLYTVKKIPPGLSFRIMRDCQKGRYAKWPEYINHYRCKKLMITSLRDMAMTLDGEFFYDANLKLNVFPNSLNFVCPPDIDDSFFEQDKSKPVSTDDLELPDGITVSDFVTSEDAP